MSMSEQLWESVDDWFAAICEHRFVQGLIDGTLPEDVFVRYVVDDAHYLVGYARALAVLASRAPDAAGVEFFAGSAASAIAAERELHREFLAPRGLDPDVDSVPPPTSTCTAYLSFLDETARTGMFDVGLAAVLPCFRVYAEVGRFVMSQRADGPHPYGSWIDTYAAPEFDAAVRRAEAYLDGVAGDFAPLAVAYRRATEFEWNFWDTAQAASASRVGGKPLAGGR